MSKSKIRIKSYTLSFLILGCFLLVTGCAVGPAPSVYQADFNIEKKPRMSLVEAYQNIKSEIRATDVEINEDVHVTSQGVSFTNKGTRFSGTYNEIQSLSVNTNREYSVDWTTISGNIPWHLTWRSEGDAQNFVDAVMTMKYYASKGSVDDTQAFADYRDKVKVWQALPQKPPLPEEVRRFRVLADDAVQNKDFDKAADYYEQGLAIDPMWPAGQFNTAMIYKELNFYSMAIMHMKRYLALKPEDTKNYRDQMYIWEEKAKESNDSSNSSGAPAVPSPSPKY
jgi:tetratricopeptide (TPR) repeat protein